MSSIIMAANAVSNGMAVFKPLYWLFGKCMAFLLDILNNQYFIALIIFTVVTRLILLPLNVKQQKSMAGTTRLQPKIQKINKKYPDPRDRDKLNQEMQDLYAREGHNPMQMGCGPMIFQMIFLMGVIGIIFYPIQYVLGASGFNDASNEIYKVILPIYQQITGNADAKITYFQLNILENFPAYKEALMQSFPKIFTSTVCSDIETYRQGMTMFGLDMTRIPHWKDGIIVIIPKHINAKKNVKVAFLATSSSATAIHLNSLPISFLAPYSINQLLFLILVLLYLILVLLLNIN